MLGLTNAINKSGMSVGLIGSNSDYSFNFEHLGFDLKSFINLIEGKNQFLKKIIAAKSPLILFGENCSHWNLNSFYTHLTNINKNINLSVLNHNVTTSGSAEFGYSMEFKSTPSSKFFIDIGHISSENEMKTKKGYWVYIGSHGHEGLKKLWFNFTSNHLFRKRISLFKFNRFITKNRFAIISVTSNTERIWYIKFFFNVFKKTTR